MVEYNLLQGLHGQTPVQSLSEVQFGAVSVALADQLEALLVRDVGENENHRDQVFDHLAYCITQHMTINE